MKIIGHRGAAEDVSENSLASFKAALNAGVDAVEFDVRVTRDEVPVINHDNYVTAGRRKLHINKNVYQDLKTVKPDILTFDQALGFLQDKTEMVIEIKPGVETDPVIDSLRTHLRRKLDKNRVIVSSFDYEILKEIRRSLPEVTLAVNEKWSGVRASRRARALGTKHIVMNQRWLWAGFIRLMSRNYLLSSYTINNLRQAERFKLAGLHAAITDYPERFT